MQLIQLPIIAGASDMPDLLLLPMLQTSCRSPSQNLIEIGQRQSTASATFTRRIVSIGHKACLRCPPARQPLPFESLAYTRPRQCEPRAFVVSWSIARTTAAASRASSRGADIPIGNG